MSNTLDKIIEKQVEKYDEIGFGNQARIVGAKRVESKQFLRQAIRQAVEEVLGEVEIPEFNHAELDALEEAGMNGYLDARDIQLTNHKKLLSKEEKK